ncbi:MAG: hypothetical protein HY335_08205, partial [Deinococcus sp.]|nr:hypothetical protein [Deinococcus sp.]
MELRVSGALSWKGKTNRWGVARASVYPMESVAQIIVALPGVGGKSLEQQQTFSVSPDPGLRVFPRQPWVGADGRVSFSLPAGRSFFLEAYQGPFLWRCERLSAANPVVVFPPTLRGLVRLKIYEVDAFGQVSCASQWVYREPKRVKIQAQIKEIGEGDDLPLQVSLTPATSEGVVLLDGVSPGLTPLAVDLLTTRTDPAVDALARQLGQEMLRQGALDEAGMLALSAVLSAIDRQAPTHGQGQHSNFPSKLARAEEQRQFYGGLLLLVYGACWPLAALGLALALLCWAWQTPLGQEATSLEGLRDFQNELAAALLLLWVGPAWWYGWQWVVDGTLSLETYPSQQMMIWLSSLVLAGLAGVSFFPWGLAVGYFALAGLTTLAGFFLLWHFLDLQLATQGNLPLSSFGWLWALLLALVLGKRAVAMVAHTLRAPASSLRRLQWSTLAVGLLLLGTLVHYLGWKSSSALQTLVSARGIAWLLLPTLLALALPCPTIQMALRRAKKRGSAWRSGFFLGSGALAVALGFLALASLGGSAGSWNKWLTPEAAAVQPVAPHSLPAESANVTSEATISSTDRSRLALEQGFSWLAQEIPCDSTGVGQGTIPGGALAGSAPIHLRAITADGSWGYAVIEALPNPDFTLSLHLPARLRQGDFLQPQLVVTNRQDQPQDIRLVWPGAPWCEGSSLPELQKTLAPGAVAYFPMQLKAAQSGEYTLE